MAHQRKGTTVEQTKHIVFNVTDKKNVALGTLQTQHESTSRRLEDEIESCKRKILQCAGQEGSIRLAKKKRHMMINTDPVNKENSGPNPMAALKSPKKNGKKTVDGEKIEFKVNAMKVVELRKELKARGMDTNGRKNILRTRLLEAMLNEAQDQSVAEVPVPNKSVPQNEEKIQSTAIQKDDVPKTTVPSEMKKNEKQQDIVDMATDDDSLDTNKKSKEAVGTDASRAQNADTNNAVASAAKEQIQQPLSAGLRKMSPKGSSNIKAYWRSKVTASPGNLHINSQQTDDDIHEVPQKKATSPLRGVLKNASSKIVSSSPAPPEVPNTNDKESSRTSNGTMDDDDDSPSEISDGSDAKIAGAKVRELVSKISGNSMHASSATPGGTGSSSALSKSVKAKKEARMARLAEMRIKSNNPHASSSKMTTPKDFSLSSSLTSSLSSSLTSSVKKNLAAQMREKAAAAYRKQEMSSTMAVVSEQPDEEPDPMDATIKRFGGLTRPDPLAATIKQGAPIRAVIQSPMDTYEISDREDSDTDDSDDSDDENEKQKKKIPTWAKRENLLPALEKQYTGGPKGKLCDPDEIFPEVQTCDLEAIFEKKKGRYTRRTSSGNWTKDRVTVEEKLVYKRTMGFARQGAEA